MAVRIAGNGGLSLGGVLMISTTRPAARSEERGVSLSHEVLAVGQVVVGSDAPLTEKITLPASSSSRNRKNQFSRRPGTSLKRVLRR